MQTALSIHEHHNQDHGQMAELTGESSTSGVKGDGVLLQQQVHGSLHILHHVMWLHQFWLQNLISVTAPHGLCDQAGVPLQWGMWFIDTCTHLRTRSTCQLQPGKPAGHYSRYWSLSNLPVWSDTELQKTAALCLLLLSSPRSPGQRPWRRWSSRAAGPGNGCTGWLRRRPSSGCRYATSRST